MSQPPTNYQPAYAPQPTGPRPSAHWGWCVVGILFFWPLCIPAFINAAKVDRLYNEGDVAGAEQASAAAKKFGLIALIVGIVLFVLMMIISIAGANG